MSAGAGKDRAGLPVPRAGAGASLGPGFQIADGVEDTATDLAVNRAGAIGAMLLKGSAREAEEICSFLGVQESGGRSASGSGMGSPRVRSGCRQRRQAGEAGIRRFERVVNSMAGARGQRGRPVGSA